MCGTSKSFGKDLLAWRAWIRVTPAGVWPACQNLQAVQALETDPNTAVWKRKQKRPIEQSVLPYDEKLGPWANKTENAPRTR